MAACDSLRLLFEKRRPMGENPTLVDSLSSWIQIKPMHHHPLEQASFTEIFGELHFKERPEPLHAAADHVRPVSHPTSGILTSTPVFVQETVSFHRDLGIPEPKTPGAHEGQGKETDSPVGKLQNPIFSNPVRTDTVKSVSPDPPPPTSPADQHGPCAKSPSPVFPVKSWESLHLCTEGLGFESSDDMEDSRSESGLDWTGGGDGEVEEEVNSKGQPPPVVLPSPKGCSDVRSRTGTGKFPPPISVIGSSGKPWVYFRAYKGDGRFVLKEVRIPTYELLQASREDGRLKLHLMQPDDRGDGME